RLAAEAGAKPGAARRLGRLVERHAIAARAPAPARRPAIDAGRLHAVDEEAVGTPVVRDDGIPPRGVVEIFVGRGGYLCCARHAVHARSIARARDRAISAACARITPHPTPLRRPSLTPRAASEILGPCPSPRISATPRARW